MMRNTTTVPKHPPPHFHAAAPAIKVLKKLFMMWSVMLEQETRSR